MRMAVLAALIGASAVAPAAMAQGMNEFGRGPPPSYQTYAHALTHQRVMGGYNEALGASQRGVPPAAQAQEGVESSPDPYSQWDYNGWNGLTQHESGAATTNSLWSARRPQYIQANPPRG